MSAGLKLRPIRMDDLDAIMTWVNDPEVTANFAISGRVISREDEARWLRQVIDSQDERVFAIETEQGAYLGNAGIHKIYWPAKNGRLGIVIGSREHHGRGLGTLALRLLIDEGFGNLGLHKLWMMHYRSNERMAHIASKLGFVCEGVLRDEYFHRGSWHDMVRHSLLSHEWHPAG